MSGMQWKRGPRAPMQMKVIRQRNQNRPLKDEKELAKQKERKVSVNRGSSVLQKLCNRNVILLFFFFPLAFTQSLH